MNQCQIWLIIIVNINLGAILGFILRCCYDEEFRDLAKQMYRMIK